MTTHLCPHGAHIQLIQLGGGGKKLLCVRPQTTVIHIRMARQSEAINILGLKSDGRR